MSAPIPAPTIVSEVPVDSPVPRMEISSWRERFGVIAGITMRGDGDPGFDLGLWSGQPVGDVMGRWSTFRSAFPGVKGFVLGRQVHGARVERHSQIRGWLLQDGVDGHVTTEAGILLLVTVADCIPVYLVVPGRPAVALLHAGWRGTAADILGYGVEHFCQAADVSPRDIVMHCGVGICGPCYEVGPEVMVTCGLPATRGGSFHLDLRGMLTAQAARLGVGRVSTSQFCSAHDRASFFSHRASGGRDGRMVAYLGVPLGSATSSTGRQAP